MEVIAAFSAAILAALFVSLSFTVTDSRKTCTYAGSYAQNGRLGSLFSQYQYSTG